MYLFPCKVFTVLYWCKSFSFVWETSQNPHICPDSVHSLLPLPSVHPLLVLSHCSESVTGSLRISIPHSPFLVPYLCASLSNTLKTNSTSCGILDHLHTPQIPPLSNPFCHIGAVCRSIKISFRYIFRTMDLYPCLIHFRT